MLSNTGNKIMCEPSATQNSLTEKPSEVWFFLTFFCVAFFIGKY